MGSGFFAKTSSWLSCALLLATASAPALAAGQPAALGNLTSSVVAASNPFTDVSVNDWAYRAIVQLHNDGLLEGYPDGYFKGRRSVTRYEIAVMTQRVVDKLESDFSDAQKATKVNSDDIALVRRLLDSYGSDLSEIKKDLATTKAEADSSAAELKRANLHVTIIARPGLSAARSTVVDGFGQTANVGQALYGTTFASQNSLYGKDNGNLRSNGKNSHGTSYETARLGVNGDLSDQLSYEAQLEDNLVYDSTHSNSGSQIFLNTAAVKYKTPTGWHFVAGRYEAKNSPVGLLYEDYFNGLLAGYEHNRYSGEVGYSFNAAANNVQGIYGISRPSQTLFAHGKYVFNDKVAAGVSYSSDLFASGNSGAASAFVLQNGLGQEVAVGQKAQTAASINAEVTVSPKLQLQGEIARHLGKDPVYNQKYLQPNSFWGKAIYGNSAQAMNHNYAEAGYIVSGVNGLSAHNSTFGLGDNYQQFYVGSLDGYHLAYVGAHHYLANNASVGLVYQRYALNSGIVLPAAVGSTNGAGTFLSHDQGQALFLETKLSF